MSFPHDRPGCTRALSRLSLHHTSAGSARAAADGRGVGAGAGGAVGDGTGAADGGGVRGVRGVFVGGASESGGSSGGDNGGGGGGSGGGVGGQMLYVVQARYVNATARARRRTVGFEIRDMIME